MGAALARTLRHAGYPTSIWNRTRERARPPGDEGLPVAAGAEAAMASADITILMLRDYEAAQTLLPGSLAQLAGKTVVNLMTGTERDARQCADLVKSAGGLAIDGTILSYPSQTGKATGTVLLCGSEKAWSACGSALLHLGGRARWPGSDHAKAAILDTAATGTFFQTSLAAFVEAAAYAAARGVGVDVLGNLVEELWPGFSASIGQASEPIATGRWGTREATRGTFYAATRVWQAEMQQAGIRAPRLSASLDPMRHAQAAGHGSGSCYAQFLTCGTRKPAAASQGEARAGPLLRDLLTR